MKYLSFFLTMCIVVLIALQLFLLTGCDKKKENNNDKLLILGIMYLQSQSGQNSLITIPAGMARD